MKLTRSKKIILMIVLTAFVVLLFNSNTVFAAINTEYSGTDTVPDTALEEAFDDSSLLKSLAKLVYVVGRFLEWILGTIFKLLTGSSDFPWADKIVFNSVPLLDVNFINPGAGSFVANESIQGVLKNLYSTIMTLAVGFFGIVVLITAIRLVITTIASEKAKYKQAIVDWLVGFVMLFCIHYFISFVFYLNEQMVIVASKIVKEQLAGADNIAKVQADDLAKEVIDEAKELGATYRGKSVATILEQNKNILSAWMNATASNETSKGIQEALMKDIRWHGLDSYDNKTDQLKNLGMIISWAAMANVSVQELTEIKNNIKVYQGYDEYIYSECKRNNKCGNNQSCLDMCKYTSNSRGGAVWYSQAISKNDLSKAFTTGKLSMSDLKNDFNAQSIFADFLTAMQIGNDGTPGVEAAQSSSTDSRLVVPAANTSDSSSYEYYCLSKGASEFGNKYSAESGSYNTNYYWTVILDDMILLKGASDTSSGKDISGSGSSTRLISDLATYFRYNSYNKEIRSNSVAGVKNGKNIQIQNMIMYTILVAQSLILFIAYVKRLFYVILIAVMGPIVVVFDFFQKFGK